MTRALDPDPSTARRTEGLDNELLALVQARVAPRHVVSVVERLAFAGEPPQTLEDIGRSRGLTRERIRQVVARFTADLAADPPATPTFDRFLAKVEALAPISGPAIGAVAHDAGSEGPWEPAAVLAAAAALGRPCSLAVHASRRLSLLVRPGDQPVVDAIFRACGDGYPGVSTPRWIAQSASDTLGRDIDADLVLRVVPGIRGFEWLLPGDDGFFWIGRTQKNHVVSCVRKVLAALGEVRLADLGPAVRRGQRFHRERVATDAAVGAICRRLPGVVVHGERVRGDPPPCRDVLSGAERAFLAVFEQEGPVQRYTRLRDALVLTELHEGNLRSLTSGSPLFTELRRGVYALVGTRGDSDAEVPPIEAIGFESATLGAVPADVLDLARLARDECELAASRHRRDAYVVRVVGRRVEQWGIDLAKPVDAVVRAIANQRQPVADGVALVRRATRRTPGRSTSGVAVIAEWRGRTVETWAADGAGPVLETEPEKVGPGGLWIGVDAGCTLGEVLEASRAERRKRVQVQ